MKATDIPESSRRAVDARDRSTCRGCGQAGQGREKHHIVYRSQERNNHDPSNLVSLCYHCHRMVHSYPETCRPLLLRVVAGHALTVLAALRQDMARAGASRGEIVERLRSLRRGTL